MFKNIMFNINQPFRKIGRVIHRAKYGWNDEDVWDFDNYLAKIIIGGLTRLKKDCHSCPNEFFHENEEDECKKWKDVLDLIILGFEAHLKITNMEYFKKYAYGKFYKDEEELKRLENQFDEGMNLFKKYFKHLWN